MSNHGCHLCPTGFIIIQESAAALDMVRNSQIVCGRSLLSVLAFRRMISTNAFNYKSFAGGEEFSIYDSNSMQSNDSSTDSGLPKSHKRTGSTISSDQSAIPTTSVTRQTNEDTSDLRAEIVDFQIMKENVMKPYAMYTVEVKVVNNIGLVDVQQVLM